MICVTTCTSVCCRIKIQLAAAAAAAAAAVGSRAVARRTHQNSCARTVVGVAAALAKTEIAGVAGAAAVDAGAAAGAAGAPSTLRAQPSEASPAAILRPPRPKRRRKMARRTVQTATILAQSSGPSPRRQLLLHLLQSCLHVVAGSKLRTQHWLR